MENDTKNGLNGDNNLSYWKEEEHASEYGLFDNLRAVKKWCEKFKWGMKNAK